MKKKNNSQSFLVGLNFNVTADYTEQFNFRSLITSVKFKNY